MRPFLRSLAAPFALGTPLLTIPIARPDRVSDDWFNGAVLDDQASDGSPWLYANVINITDVAKKGSITIEGDGDNESGDVIVAVEKVADLF